MHLQDTLGTNQSILNQDRCLMDVNLAFSIQLSLPVWLELGQWK